MKGIVRINTEVALGATKAFLALEPVMQQAAKAISEFGVWYPHPCRRQLGQRFHRCGSRGYVMARGKGR